MRPYSEYFKTIPSDKGHNIFYECKCDDLFDLQGSYFLMLMIVDKKCHFVVLERDTLLVIKL